MTSRWLEMMKMIIGLVYRLFQELFQPAFRSMKLLKMMPDLVYRLRELFLLKRQVVEMMLKMMLDLVYLLRELFLVWLLTKRQGMCDMWCMSTHCVLHCHPSTILLERKADYRIGIHWNKLRRLGIRYMTDNLHRPVHCRR